MRRRRLEAEVKFLVDISIIYDGFGGEVGCSKSILYAAHPSPQPILRSSQYGILPEAGHKRHHPSAHDVELCGMPLIGALAPPWHEDQEEDDDIAGPSGFGAGHARYSVFYTFSCKPTLHSRIDTLAA